MYLVLRCCVECIPAAAVNGSLKELRSNDSEYFATNKGDGLVRGCEIARILEMLYVLTRPELAL